MEHSRERALEGFCRSCGNNDHATEAHGLEKAQKEQRPKPKESEKTLAGFILAATVPTDTNSLAFWTEIAGQISHEQYLGALSNVARVIDATEYLTEKKEHGIERKEIHIARHTTKEKDTRNDEREQMVSHIARALARNAEQLKKAKELHARLNDRLKDEQGKVRPNTQERFTPVALRALTKSSSTQAQHTTQPPQKRAA